MQQMASPQVAIIGDLVGSRRQPSRAATQLALEEALAVANREVAATQPLEPTIGDELQGVHPDLASAMRALLVVRLALPGELDVRFGLGVGTLEVVGSSRYGLTQDGPAWWAAREAIVQVKDQERALPGLRSRVHGRDGGPDDTANAYLLCRDQIVGGFDARQRRLALGVLLGTTQKQLAASEGISASAVSQSLRRSGAAVVLASVQEVGR